MTTITNLSQISINAPLETVFNYVSDLTRHPEWSGGQLKIEALTPGPAAVGSRYQSYGEVAGQKDRPNELRVTEYQPPTRFAFIAHDPDFKDVSHVFTFQPQGNGTLMERAVTVTMPALPAFLFRIAIYPLVGKPMMDKALAALKAKLEQRSPAGG